ncbi:MULTISPECIES: hypothetical protein [Burkholderia]|uniref:hypothetical protein n=1 Tax=Burkholderia TaxID=32008 RepID=UPI0012BD20D0|nr:MULTISPECIES: hypothetical protein [Burkholderia]
MNQNADGIADLRRLVILLSDRLETVSEEVVRLMCRLDAYQMVMEGLILAPPDWQTVFA